MNVYRIKHVPTGEFYSGQWGSTNKTGKIYPSLGPGKLGMRSLAIWRNPQHIGVGSPYERVLAVLGDEWVLEAWALTKVE